MEDDKKQIKQSLKLKLKKYLELENVSILAGAGTSWHLGAPTIRKIPDNLKEELSKEINLYFPKDSEPSYEDLFNCLQADKFLKINKNENTDEIQKSIHKMQSWLFSNCNTEKTSIKDKKDLLLKENRYYYHELFIKKLLQRPSNLKRANLFTTNYDLAFDYALDNLGIHYINGFSGVHNRCFRPEVYDYDIYYPGQSVSGKVHRAEKVLRYYKLHGSLSWIATEETLSNPYGIKEIPIDNFNFQEQMNLMIYPCVSKKTFTLDLPYSELFRHFANSIIQPQSVLIALGYSFYDEHINDIIYQALTIPSFTLIIANYSPDKNENIEKLKRLNDSRIIIIDEANTDDKTNTELSTFTGFVKNVMPDLYEEEENEAVLKTMKELYPADKQTSGDSGNEQK
ncbi:SIR2 family protein [Treponema berlinense]|uniref:SIR2 family protein n=1 Tax=Treponema berlinense TaxID=225004 RepID=UPI0023F938AB|nr:SIR2 family protein [Treponema berlinense]